MVGQAAIGNPWIFTPYVPTSSEKLEMVLRHLDLSVACEQLFSGMVLVTSEQLETQIEENLKKPDFAVHALVEFRKFLFQYVKGMSESREWKPTILQITQYGELREAIRRFFEK
jgi:tRNA-dihydrouridine synthase